eukprot:CAMPEP_0171993540 /NCGR_PEP_ID=MMETSP0993-20121228/278498_1 /TAXON_ID=483369 /ORGANISM="non described non described, Strain CCMP2098" /LENGTH=176 /DNA_ID=CAMNT_0012646597 /DNA_START=196 /DNA_END=726 /DNA_ORIENTATION=+
MRLTESVGTAPLSLASTSALGDDDDDDDDDEDDGVILREAAAPFAVDAARAAPAVLTRKRATTTTLVHCRGVAAAPNPSGTLLSLAAAFAPAARIFGFLLLLEETKRLGSVVLADGVEVFSRAVGAAAVGAEDAAAVASDELQVVHRLTLGCFDSFKQVRHKSSVEESPSTPCVSG